MKKRWRAREASRPADIVRLARCFAIPAFAAVSCFVLVPSTAAAEEGSSAPAAEEGSSATAAEGRADGSSGAQVRSPGAAGGEEPSEGEIIVSIESDEIPGEDVVARSGLRVGNRLTRAAARRAIHEIWRTGRVSDVRVLSRPAPGGVRVRIRLTLEQVVRGLEVVWAEGGDGPLDRQTVARAIGYFAGMPWRGGELRNLERRLAATFARRGYPDAEIRGEVVPVRDDPESVSLRFHIDPGEPLLIRRISYEGTLGLEEGEVRRVLGLSPGDVFDRERLASGLQAVLERYRREGYLMARVSASDVNVRIVRDADGERRVDLVIPLDAGDHYQIDIVGNRYFSDDELIELLALQEESDITAAVLDTLAGKLRDHYRNLGFYFARVDWRIFRRGPGERRLAFRIRRGPRVDVREIRFEGNEHFDTRHLRRQVVAQLQDRLGERGLFRRVSDDDVAGLGVTGEVHESWRPGPRRHPRLRVHPERVFVPEIYDEALEHIRDLYAADGYLRMNYGEPRLQFSEDRTELVVTIDIEEGPQTLIRSISFAGNENFPDERILGFLHLDLGAPLNRYEVEQDRRRIIRAYHDAGYVFVSVRTSEQVDDDGLGADIRYEIEEGPRVRVGTIIVRGNDITRTSLIRDRILLRPGEFFSPDLASRSERALIDLGVFTTVSVTLADPDRPAAVKDVIVEVVERPPQRLEARLGFSTADGPRGGLRYAYTNLAGAALGVELRVQLSYQVFFLGTPEFERFVDSLPLADRLERLIVLSLHAPHIPRVGRALDLRLDGSHERDNDPAYAVTRYALTLSGSSGYRPYFTAQMQTGFNFSDIEQVQDLPDCLTLDADERRPGSNCLWVNIRNTQLARAPQGTAWFWITRMGLTLDFRDNPFTPSRGFFGSISAEHVYSLVPTTETIINDPDDPSDDTTVSRRSNLIKLSVALNGYIPLGFYDIVLALQVRFGWIFELSPDSFTFPDRFFYLGGFDSMRGFPEESLIAQDTAEPGGNSMLNLRAELRIPLPSNFALGVFIDMGNLWREQINLWRDFALRYCLGAGIRFNTPVGPLALDGAFILDRREGEPIGAIQFAIGLF